MKRESLVWLTLSVLICAPSTALATITIDVGNHTLLANSPNQSFDIVVSSTVSETVNNTVLFLDINNDVGLAPVITGYNLTSDPTIWSAHGASIFSFGPPYDPSLPASHMAKIVYFNDTSHSVSANGILARIIVDTTGLVEGSSWFVDLTSEDFGPSTIGLLKLNYDAVLVPGALSLVGPTTLFDGGGGPSVVGGAGAMFPGLSAPGTFASSFYEPGTPAEIAQTLASLNAGQSTFILPGAPAQIWDLDFTGAFTGNATVTLSYNPASVTVGPSLLRIRHWTGSEWVTPANQIVDPVAHTITFDTESFSPFLLTVVPEPSSLAMGVLGSGLLAAAAWRRRK